MAFFESLFWFVVLLTPIVFVHELGHYLVARWNRVRIEVFSIGFGPELFGFNDRVGTRWKFSLLPLGGYVKMLGQGDLVPDELAMDAAAEADRAHSFMAKRPGQKIAIVLAGPAANFVFALVTYVVLFATYGQAYTPAQVDAILPGSAAEAAGIQIGDRITAVDGHSIRRFEELAQLIQLQPNREVTLAVLRDDREIEIKVTPRSDMRPDGLGDEVEIGLLGVQSLHTAFVRHDPLTAMVESWRQTVRSGSVIFIGLGQMLTGDRSPEEMGGPVRIAQMARQVVGDAGWHGAVLFAALLSVNLGVLNLLPIPVLDGGHLLFYFYEAVRGRPPGLRLQEYSLRFGMALLLTLMLFATLNDTIRLPLFRQMIDLLS